MEMNAHHTKEVIHNMNNKHLLIFTIIGLLFFIILITTSCTSEARIYEESINTPDFDGYANPGGGGSNSSTELLIWNGAPGTRRAFMEFNITSLPKNAQILNISLEYYITQMASDSSDRIRVTQMEGRPSDLTFTQGYNDAGNGTIYYNDLAGAQGGVGWADINSSFNDWNNFNILRTHLEENLTLERDWFGLGFYGVTTDNYIKQQWASNDSSNPPRLWIQYEINAPIIVNVSYPEGSTDVNCTPHLCINISHDDAQDMNITWYEYNESSASFDIQFGYNGTVTNGTYCKWFANATEPCTTYYWYVEIEDEYGNITSEVYWFTTHCIDPPSNIDCTDYEQTGLNITFDPYPDHNGTSHTVCYYREGFNPPAWGVGTFINTTNSTINISGLDSGQCYAFSFWTNWQHSNGSWHLSESANTHTCCVGGGEYKICLRDEDTLDALDFTTYPHAYATHRLIVHYDGALQDTYIINASTVWQRPDSTCINVTAIDDVLYFELRCFDDFDVTSMSNSACERTPYVRKLLPSASQNISGNETVVFYVANRSVYNTCYYCKNATGTYNTSCDNLMDESVIKYIFSYIDEVGDFSRAPPNDVFVTYKAYNATLGEIIIHQEYWDSAQKSYPHLIYEKAYWTEINCTTRVIKNIGLAPTHELIQETVIIDARLDYSVILDGTSVNFGFKTGGGIWTTYTNNVAENYTITQATLNIYLNDVIVYTKTVNFQSYNYTYPAGDSSNDYVLQLNITRRQESTGQSETYTLSYYLLSGFSGLSKLDANYINNLLIFYIGHSPIYNPETGASTSWVTLGICLVGIIILVGVSMAGQATSTSILYPLGFIGSGLFMGFTTVYVSNLEPIIITSAFLFIILGFLIMITMYIRRK